MRFLALALLLALLACTPAHPTPVPYPTYDPFVPAGENTNLPIPANGTIPDSTRPAGPTPTRAPLSVTPAGRAANQPLLTPTPDSPHLLPTPRQQAEQYVVQAGDTLGGIAERYGVSVPALMEANHISNPNLLSVGVILNIPAPQTGEQGSPFKIIPDSELVYGPASALFALDSFIQSKGGYLSSYTQDIDGTPLSAAQIILRVAQYYSVNPRLLLALIEYRSGWVTQPQATPSDYPLGLLDANHAGLYRQLTWAANELNRGYYLWRANAVSTWVLADGTVIPIAPTINAGTAAVQAFFARQDDQATWQKDVGPFGLFQTYYFLFGNPFDLAIEPLLPAGLSQPHMTLPFERGVIWAFTGGPHGGWDTGSAWAALDFAPVGETQGCYTSDAWVTAVANGLIVRSGDGAVLQDLDNDGYEQTGWVIFYMHVESRDRVQAGTYVYTGDRIGHPSCEGGVSKGTHLHLARKYNGEWIPADGNLPFILDGWVSSGNGNEYDGFLKRGAQTLEAWNGISEINEIKR
ncbi:MAG: LysM peptidoglycan-binding domain-containing protein [Anaerolineae bacterium]